MLRWFERRLDPFPDAPPSQPPATLVAFCRHYTRGAERWLLLMAATTGLIAIAEVALLLVPIAPSQNVCSSVLD